ncbi:hypothetical protein F2Q69_00059833 [Brassica cretica]|uniref:Uncharacterized protein n=1 Tax=Brassica cretica TaxID=69181 RepID=A0A8S9REJ6_BRACR|nr:hypothetical protein F2Q69_00059833 [Brassica cretica]
MVSSRIVDLDENVYPDNMESIPDMMFSAGEEPVGVRRVTYFNNVAGLSVSDKDQNDIAERSAFPSVTPYVCDC